MFVHVSRLIPKPLSRARKNGLERGDHESRINKNLNHVSREKNSLDHASRKKYKGPSMQTLFWHVTDTFGQSRHLSLGREDCVTSQNSVCKEGTLQSRLIEELTSSF